MSFDLKFSNLGSPSRIWTVASVNGQLERLVEIHKAIYDRFAPGDRLVYTGNYLGAVEGAMPLETMDEILFFRRTLLAREGLLPEDFVYLRGTQEELLGKFLQLQFAPDPRQIVDWIEKVHPEMDSILKIYGTSLADAGRTAREGVINVTRWAMFLKQQIRGIPGHETFFSILRRAAFTENGGSNDNNLLFVHAGLNPDASLMRQGDSFWWAGLDFNELETPCAPFKSVVRGFDPAGRGIHIGKCTISLDGAGKIVCARLSNDGDVQELIAA